MQIPGMNVWRPGLLLSLVVDFMFFKANSVGYYWTNLTYFVGDVLLVYAVVRQFTAGWSKLRSSAAAFFGAALFAASPLHCESVSWVVGRVDVICCFYYLLSFWLFLRSKSGRPKLYIGLAILSFWLGLITKEMAIGLPVLVTVTEYLGIGCGDIRADSGQRLRAAASASMPFWAATFFYFIIRYACLGTFVGGYVAGFGASQDSSMLQRWFDPDTIKRLFFPFCHGLFSGPTIYAEALKYCYTALLSLAFYRLIENRISTRWLLFLIVWLASTAAPIFQLWGLGDNLEGARFYFFLSIPLWLTMPILLFCPQPGTRSNSVEGKMLLCSALALCATMLVMARVTYMTNLEWVKGGKEVRQLSIEAQKLAGSEPAKTQIIVLGIPKERNGAHQILNGSTFGTMLKPPFVSTDFAGRFTTFDPIMYGPPDLINASRFRSALHSHAEAFLWSGKDNRLVRLNLDTSIEPLSVVNLPISTAGSTWSPCTRGHAVYGIDDGAITVSKAADGDGIVVKGLDLNPLAADFLEFQYTAVGLPANAVFTINASGKNSKKNSVEPSVASVNMLESNEFKTVRVRLSRFWRWFCQGPITELTVQPYPGSSVVMRNFRLLPSDLLCPTISIASAKEDGAGISHSSSGDIVDVSLDAMNVERAAYFQVEIGKVNYFSDNFEKIKITSPVAYKINIDVKNRIVRLDSSQFRTPGYYQLRVRCLDGALDPIGEYSDSVTLKVGKK